MEGAAGSLATRGRGKFFSQVLSAGSEGDTPVKSISAGPRFILSMPLILLFSAFFQSSPEGSDVIRGLFST